MNLVRLVHRDFLVHRAHEVIPDQVELLELKDRMDLMEILDTQVIYFDCDCVIVWHMNKVNAVNQKIAYLHLHLWRF